MEYPKQGQLAADISASKRKIGELSHCISIRSCQVEQGLFGGKKGGGARGSRRNARQGHYHGFIGNREHPRMETRQIYLNRFPPLIKLGDYIALREFLASRREREHMTLASTERLRNLLTVYTEEPRCVPTHNVAFPSSTSVCMIGL